MSAISLTIQTPTPQCQFFVIRKKRLCRMTVRPGRQYCGEHEPEPRTEEGKDDLRIPCPNDPKHTCYASKLEKHLTICNARQTEMPPYIEHNINAPVDIDSCVRKPLSEIPKDTIKEVIEKVNLLYEKHIAGNILPLPQLPIHPAVQQEFSEADRGESSRRHMRQASSILHIVERAGLVRDGTCYVELGAGKGQLSFYMGSAWCGAGGGGGGGGGSRVVVVDRAALRHKRDNKLRERERVTRVRADLAHLALCRLPQAQGCARLVGVAKHLCGVATDYALRCITWSPAGAGAGAGAKGAAPTSGLVLATCCHHRCERAAYLGNAPLLELGISGEDLNVMLGVVSWATCGDGRSRERRKLDPHAHKQRDSHTNTSSTSTTDIDNDSSDMHESDDTNSERLEHSKEKCIAGEDLSTTIENKENSTNEVVCKDNVESEQDKYFIGGTECRAEVGRRAKALLDWGRVLYLRGRGFDARLCYYVPQSVSPENLCIVATKPDT